ncbi:alpha/beta hydrolase [uncultured Corynebacterium sp.]|uniref:alpha/beta hydrolase n=1 Tax=uncultured Corynebacterium sp. TaxID=159447 RepID=UPI0025EE9286|nr:alpha/beta fold hydrolase [uncultured Corynebacterium sp.]
MTRTDVTFPSGDATCAAWLYVPDGAPAPGPIIVMAHGLAGVRQMRLDAFAERFTAAGYRCLVFDYRHFGASGGEPRQLLSVRRQLDDWVAAIAHARSLDGVDPDRVIIWGTSFGGGHVIRTAARDPRLAAVIAQCPFTDGLASALALPPMILVKIGLLAVRDLVAAWRNRKPIMVPAYGEPGSTALMTAPDCVAGIEAIVPPGDDIRSDITARFGLDIVRYFPGRSARKISCPAHVAVCEDDSVAPPRPTLRHVRKAPKGEVHMLPGGHFDIYVGDDFERNIAQQLDFLARHVPAAGDGA